MAKRQRKRPAAPAKKKGAAKGKGKTAEDKALDGMIAVLNQNHGAGTVQRMSSDGLSIHIPGVISTGSESLDKAIGRGGYPRGRIVLLSADEGVGKTTLALHACANVQRAGGFAVYIDAEYKLDMGYAGALGVDNDRLILSQPKHAEQAFDIIDDVIKIQAKANDPRPVLVVVDSVNALPTEAELEGKGGLGALARVFSERLKLVNPAISKGSVILLLISQHREKIGVMFGSSKTTGGGKAPRFYCSVGIKMVAVKGLKEDGLLVGQYSKVEVWKNQVAPPFKRCELLIRYGHGIDYYHSVHAALKASGIVTSPENSSWTYFKKDQPDGFKWQGMAGLKAQFGKPERATALMKALRAQYEW